MKIVADENIPYVNELFSPFGEITLAPGRAMSPDLLEGADALLVRSVTAVNEKLLKKSQVRFVGTCTIGTDHLDKTYLTQAGISYASAPGCNANGVVQYVMAALCHLNQLDSQKQVSIVGFGNVGKRLYQKLISLGFRVNCFDPFKTQADCEDLVEFESVFDSDIVCLHAPYTRSGPHPTQNMFAKAEFERLKPGALLLNAGRGQVVNNAELLDYLKNKNDLTVVLDVWQNEPAINSELFKHIAIGTPHIAGYSYEGRINGSMMIYQALVTHLGIEQSRSHAILSKVLNDAFGEPERITATSLAEAVLKVYPIQRDHAKLASALETLPDSFDSLRKNYFKRREFSHYLCSAKNSLEKDALITLGFLLKETQL